MRKPVAVALLSLAVQVCAPAAEAVPEEFKVKREAVFEFAARPAITRRGDRVTIAFETKGFCDVTIAVENREGRIIRHLVSGVLGKNAPAPLAKNSKKQQVVWDGKDDRGRYVDDKDVLSVRVSLGLKPRFEKHLFGHPMRRISYSPLRMCPAPEGVYVFDARGLDFLRLFDHDGNYVRTLYPFAADKVGKVKGLKTHRLPQSGKLLPYKHGFTLASMLTSGTSCIFDGIGDIKHGRGIAATAIAVHKNRVALAYLNLNRLATDGTSGGLALKGGRTGYRVSIGSSYGRMKGAAIGPTSAAFSPDGKWLYLTGYLWKHGGAGWVGGCLNGVIRLDYEKGTEPEVFAGKMTSSGYGSGPGQLAVPTSVACDSKGRVYVADHWNDRIQVFSPAGKLLKSIRTFRPTKVMLHHKTGEIWVCSYLVFGVPRELARKDKKGLLKTKPTVTRFGPFENPRRIAGYDLPLGRGDTWSMLERGQQSAVELDSWAEPPTLWIAGRKLKVTAAWVRNWQSGAFKGRGSGDAWRTGGAKILTLKDGKWVVKRDFSQDVAKKYKRVTPPDHSSQRLHVNPRTGKLYVHEQRHPLKSFIQLIEITPESGKVKLVDVPMSAEDICFDLDGLAYLRTDTAVMRFDPRSWREVPWDYGEQRARVGFSYKGTKGISALSLPGRRPVCYNMGGMWISPRGHLVVSCCTMRADKKRNPSGDWKSRVASVGKVWRPQMYPGRVLWQQVHVWDKHGKLISEDALPGLWRIDAVHIDRDDNLYLMANATRFLGGEMYPNEMVGTLIKARAGKARVKGTGRSPIPLPAEAHPKRDPDLRTAKLGRAWVEGAEWMYGGVGYGGFNTAKSGGGCACWHARGTLDLFARSFAPEIEHFSVAVLDTAGNLILRVGRYGNEDDGIPMRNPGGPSRTRLGGDEVALFHPSYLATMTDRRLFIADPGNNRIVSVKLGYHASETTHLKDVPDLAAGRRP